MNNVIMNDKLTGLDTQFVLVFSSVETRDNGTHIRWYTAFRAQNSTYTSKNCRVYKNPICRIGVFSESLTFIYNIDKVPSTVCAMVDDVEMDNSIAQYSTGKKLVLFIETKPEDNFNAYDKMNGEYQMQLLIDLLAKDKPIKTALYKFILNEKYKDLFVPKHAMMDVESYSDIRLASDLCGLYIVPDAIDEHAMCEIEFKDVDMNSYSEYMVQLDGNKIIKCKYNYTGRRPIDTIIDIDTEILDRRDLLISMLKDINNIYITFDVSFELLIYGDLDYELSEDRQHIIFNNLNNNLSQKICSATIDIRDCISGMIRGNVSSDGNLTIILNYRDVKIK